MISKKIVGLLLITAMFTLSVGAVPAHAEGLRDKVNKVFPVRAVIGQGKVESKSDSSLTVSANSVTYTVNLGTNVVFHRKYGAKSTLAEISVGDNVNVVGTFTDSTKTIISARLIRDLSLQTRKATFVGNITSLTSGGFVMTTTSNKRVDQTVTISSTTQIVDRKNTAMTSASLKVGDRVSVKGMWNNTNNTVTEVSKIKDFSVPAK